MLCHSEGYQLEEFEYSVSGGPKQMVVCRERDSERLESDYLTVFMNVMERGYLQLFSVLDTLPEDAIVYGYNTDAVYFTSSGGCPEMTVDDTSLETLLEQPIKYSIITDKHRINDTPYRERPRRVSRNLMS